MRVGVFLPKGVARAEGGGKRVPALIYLAGLTCTEETFPAKAGAARLASELGMALVSPDTSPRHVRYPGDDAAWDFGLSAGFYVDATERPWSDGYRMFSYVTDELPRLLANAFPIDPERLGISGHSMGGHGALVCALRRPDRFRSVSALAPICAPSQVPWGQKAFRGYLGADEGTWSAYDACALLRARRLPGELLVDQGLADKFLERELCPERLEAACAAAGSPLTLRRHEGYDHGYYFVASFIDDHVRHHAKALIG